MKLNYSQQQQAAGDEFPPEKGANKKRTLLNEDCTVSFVFIHIAEIEKLSHIVKTGIGFKKIKAKLHAIP